MRWYFGLGCFIASALVLSPLVAQEEPPVRGLKTHLIEQIERESVRRFPAVLEPDELTVLSFEIAGKLERLSVAVGQKVKQGEIVARLDPTALNLQIETAQAGLDQARAGAKNAADKLARQEVLFQRKTVTRAAVDEARTNAEVKAAQLVQAEKSLQTSQENLSKAILRAPYDGIVNSVDAESFATVGAGTPILSFYRAENFELAFSVNFDVANQLVVGKPAQVRLADRPDIVLDAVVSELGGRADSVSSFPIVLSLTSTHPVLKAGMAAEAAIALPLQREQGFTVPLSVAINRGKLVPEPGTPISQRQLQMELYVYDPKTSTVKRRQVIVGGVRENALIVVDGLEAGERVASAGVSFLRDGQKVKLLEDGR